MSSFPWGRVIDTFEVRLDNTTHTITKYHPRKTVSGRVLRQIDTDTTMYHCEDINQASQSLEHLYLTIMAENNLGLNQHSLVRGLARALGIGGEK